MDFLETPVRLVLVALNISSLAEEYQLLLVLAAAVNPPLDPAYIYCSKILEYAGHLAKLGNAKHDCGTVVHFWSRQLFAGLLLKRLTGRRLSGD